MSHKRTFRSSPRVETFEGLVDLFTTLSMVLITAAVVYGLSRPNATKATFSEIQFRNAGSGGTVGADLPRDSLLLLIWNNSGTTELAFKQGVDPAEPIARGPREGDIRAALDKYRERFEGASYLYIAFRGTTADDNSALVAVEKWMTDRRFAPTVLFENADATS